MAASTKKTKKNKENKEIPNMKNKSKEYKILLLYDILATSDCLCSASPAYNTILQLHPNKKKLQQPADRLLQKPVKKVRYMLCAYCRHAFSINACCHAQRGEMQG